MRVVHCRNYFYIIIPRFMDYLVRLASWTDAKLKSIPTLDIALGVLGLLVALLIGLLLSFTLGKIPWSALIFPWQ